MSSWTAGLEGRLRRAPLLWPALALLIGVGLAPLVPVISPLLVIPCVVVALVAAVRRPGHQECGGQERDGGQRGERQTPPAQHCH